MRIKKDQFCQKLMILIMMLLFFVPLKWFFILEVHVLNLIFTLIIY